MSDKAKAIALRYALYIGGLILLLAGIVIAILAVGRSGAWLTNEGDWQELTGEYRIGVIDYTVTLNGETLIQQVQNKPVDYRMVVPIQGAVRFFDPTVTPGIRSQEFNQGATLMRIHVVNNSDSLIEIGGTLTLDGVDHSGNGNSAIRFLPLPVSLKSEDIRSLDRRKFVLDTLALDSLKNTVSFTEATETAALATLQTAYEKFYGNAAGTPLRTSYTASFPNRNIPGKAAGGGANSDDFFALVWTEYNGGTYNVDETKPSPAVSPAPIAKIDKRQSHFTLSVTVGQRENASAGTTSG